MTKNNNFIKLYIGSILTIFMILFSWKTMYGLSCLSLLLPLVILLVISYSYIDRKMNEKVCFKNCYFKHSSKLTKFLISPYFVSIFYFIFSMMLTLSLMYQIINYQIVLWLYLLIHILLVIIIYHKLIHILSDSIQERYLEIFARELTIKISSVFLFMVYIYVFANGYSPEYLSTTLQTTIENASNSITSSCIYIDSVLRINAEVDSLFWWATEYSTKTVNDTMPKELIWISFIVINTLSILGINRFIVQIIYVLNKIFKKKT